MPIEITQLLIILLQTLDLGLLRADDKDPACRFHLVNEIKRVTFTGERHYTSANSTVGKPCKPGKAKVTQVYQPLVSRHPYHLVAVSGGGSTVYGWVDAADIKTEAAALAVGDQVTMDKAATVYGTTRKFSSWVYSAKLYVRAISGDRISVSTLKSGAITGNVDKKYLTKV